MDKRKRKKTTTKTSNKAPARTGGGRKRRKGSRRKRQMQQLLQGLFLGLCICMLLFSIWKLAGIFLGYRSGDKEYKELQQYVLEEADAELPTPTVSPDSEDGEAEDTEAAPARMSRIDLASLLEINSECIGWIEIPGTDISYPMVHTTDNEYYLTHTFRREENKAGSIFLETANNADFSDLHTIIHGHNMKNGSMFAGLKNYKKESYYEKHPHIFIDLADGSHCYQIFSCHQAPSTDITYTIGYSADDTYATFLNALKESSLYDTGVDVTTSDHVITLSTCTNSGKDRFVVHAKKLY